MKGSGTHGPDDLAIPEDDGAAAHLRGARMPSLALPATNGVDVRVDVPPGCTPEACGFRDHAADLAAAAAWTAGVSTQTCGARLLPRVPARSSRRGGSRLHP
jgi:hypothetical protein